METNHKLALLIIILLSGICSNAQLSEEELAKIAQNPLANIISVPIQNNTNYGVGPYSRTQNTVNIQPECLHL